LGGFWFSLSLPFATGFLSDQDSITIAAVADDMQTATGCGNVSGAII
jgi:hypothetical protein